MKQHFIHIPKNGGMTIRNSPQLMGRITISTPNNHISPEYTKNLENTMRRDGEHHGHQHARWRDLKDTIRNNGTCFSVIRNPWSRVVSRYTFSELAHKNGSKYAPQSFSFEEFLEQRHEFGGKEFYWHRAIKGWYLQKDYVTDIDGNLKVDILRLEHLNDDVSKYFDINFTDRRRNRSNVDKIDYRSFYNDETKQIVADWYAEDIDFFGFTFDSAATKNIWSRE